MKEVKYSFAGAGDMPRRAFGLLASALFILLIAAGGQSNAYYALPGRESFSGLYHFVFYSGLACLLWFGLKRPSILKVTALVCTAGGMDEIAQWFHPFRHPAMDDLLVDLCAGLATSVLLHWWTIGRVRRPLAGQSG